MEVDMLTINNIVWFEGGRGMITEVGDAYVKVNGKVAHSIEGALILPDFLRKNGWRFDGKRKVWRVGNDFAYVELSEMQDYWVVKINNNVYDYKGWISFVHELQQAMSICAVKFNWKL